MRYLSAMIACFPSILWAGDIPLQSTVSEVLLYPQGATITREVAFDAPAGQHQLVFTNLPPSTPLERVRVQIEGAVMGSVSMRNDYLPPADIELISAAQDIEMEIEQLETRIEQQKAEIDLIKTETEAAQSRVSFLNQLGRGDGVAALGVEALRDLTSMIGDETQKALRTAHEAEQRVKAAQANLEETQEALDRARQMRRALLPGQDDGRTMLSVAIDNEAAVSGRALVTYTIYEAGWVPVYDFKLSRDTGTLDIERGAFISQSSGENWDNVALTLSTVRPSEQTAPSHIWPWLRRIYNPEQVRLENLSRKSMESDALGGAIAFEPAAADAVIVEEASASFDGLSVTYAYPDTVNVANNADRLRIALGTISSPVDLKALAVPLSDQTAYLMASFENTSEEIILPTWEAMYYLDDRFVGQRGVELVPAGGTADLSFGPIEGLRLTRDLLDRNQGDRGVITKSNELTESARLSIENLTGEDWDIRLLDRVPYSEQEDLQITWQADLEPAERDVDSKRGVLAWEFKLPARETQTINLSYQIEWPEGQALQ